MTTIIAGRRTGLAAVSRWMDPTSPPHPWMLAPWEFWRAAAELSGSLVLSPALVALHGVGRLDRTGARADVHPVLVVPGLQGGNAWTALLRAYLRALGHDVRTLDPRTMKAGRVAVVRSLAEQIDRLTHEAGCPISVVAWSIGGCFVRQSAADQPAAVRRLITLGTPIDGSLWYGRGEKRRTLRLPVTSIYSRTDGIVDWRRCVLPAAPGAENVKIVSSHFGMSTNPQALHVIGDRLSR